jgi:hypothetical protein
VAAAVSCRLIPKERKEVGAGIENLDPPCSLINRSASRFGASPEPRRFLKRRYFPMRLMPKTIALAAVLAAGIALFGPAPRAHATLLLEGTVQVGAGTPVTVYATDNNVAYPGGLPRER